jgi:lysophospholipase L1-like esterase
MGVNFGSLGNAASADLAWGAKRKAKPSGKLAVFGDSITQGQGVTAPAGRYSSLIASSMSWVETNGAIAGSGLARWVNDKIGSMPIAAGDQFIVLPGFNDARFHGADPQKLAQYVSNLIGTLCWLGVPDDRRIYSQAALAVNPALTAVGTWVASATWQGAQAQSRCGAYSSVSGSYLEGVVYGNCVHVMLGGYPTFNSRVKVHVDGQLIGSSGGFSAKPLMDVTDGQGGAVWQPFCVRVPRPDSGPHTVRVEVDAAQNALVGYIAGFDSASSALPTVYVGSAPRMTPAGYALAPNLADDNVIRQYQQATQRVCSALAAEGLMIRYVDIDSAWLPSAATLAADGVHPNEVPHSLWASRFLHEMARPSLS